MYLKKNVCVCASVCMWTVNDQCLHGSSPTIRAPNFANFDFKFSDLKHFDITLIITQIFSIDK